MHARTQVEFTAAATSLGFGSVAHTIFQDLDVDRSGFVSYNEVLASLQELQVCEPATKSMLVALAQQAEASRELTATGISPSVMDTSSWVVRGRDADTVQAELQALLRESGAYVSDLIRVFDEDAGATAAGDLVRRGHIDDVEFSKAMRERFGFKGPKRVLDEIFNRLDSDGSGSSALLWMERLRTSPTHDESRTSPTHDESRRRAPDPLSPPRSPPRLPLDTPKRT